jgi:hypothetical protein
VLALLSFGSGLLLERVSDVKLPGTLVVPCGFAVLALIAQLATMTESTAQFAVPAVVAAAAAGFGLALPWRGRRLDVWAAGATVAAFAAYAAPIVLSGQATFAGYIKLDDDSTFLAMTDRAWSTGGASPASTSPRTCGRSRS